MPPPTPPTSQPPLNDDEIQKIQNNLSIMHEFNFELKESQVDIINEVF